MNGSVLGALRLDDSDSLRSEILRAEAEFTVSVSAVEGIPSPSLTRVCIFFDYWFPWNLRFLEYPERTFGMIYRLNGKDFCKSLTVKYEKHMCATKMADWARRDVLKSCSFICAYFKCLKQVKWRLFFQGGYQGSFCLVRCTAYGFFHCFSS